MKHRRCHCGARANKLGECFANRCGEWCDHNRISCDRVLPWLNTNVSYRCGRSVAWLAPSSSPSFPLAYCLEHAPQEAVSA